VQFIKHKYFNFLYRERLEKESVRSIRFLSDNSPGFGRLDKTFSISSTLLLTRRSFILLKVSIPSNTQNGIVLALGREIVSSSRKFRPVKFVILESQENSSLLTLCNIVILLINGQPTMCNSSSCLPTGSREVRLRQLVIFNIFTFFKKEILFPLNPVIFKS
jgi:hypothetical protein